MTSSAFTNCCTDNSWTIGYYHNSQYIIRYFAIGNDPTKFHEWTKISRNTNRVIDGALLGVTSDNVVNLHIRCMTNNMTERIIEKNTTTSSTNKSRSIMRTTPTSKTNSTTTFIPISTTIPTTIAISTTSTTMSTTTAQSLNFN